ncbi:MAG: serine protease [Melioribacteraceae bacterium]|nr:serine protease [Melioribacteraceae bacterium]
MSKRILVLTALFISLITLSCTSVYETVYPALTDGKYDSEFPYKSTSKQLEEISNSIKLLNSIAFYNSYVFDESTKLLVNDIKKIELEKNATQIVYFNRTSSGTATVVLEDLGIVALLSVAHIVNFPDTVISYFVKVDGSLSEYVQSVSVKTRQSNYIPDLPEGGELEIILMDKSLDICLLGKKFHPTNTASLAVFNYPWGNSTELEWGSFIYVFGFPMNYKMISKGIVSSPGREKHTFLIDAVFNRGSSGGIVLAIRDGVPNFELVGLVKSVPADFQYVLHPISKQQDLEFNPMIPYKGDIYVQKEQVLRTGITKVIGIESVAEFIKQHRSYLLSKGYYFKNFF